MHHRQETLVSRDAQNVCAITIVGTVLNAEKKFLKEEGGKHYKVKFKSLVLVNY